MSDDPRFDLTLLYVEDDPSTRLECAEILRRRVKVVLTAEDGRAGLELFQRHHPELVVTDIRMPLMDGLQMACAIRELAPAVRIIVTTAHGDSSYLLEAIAAGIDHYVLKPIAIHQLVTAVEKCSRDILAHQALVQQQVEREKLIGELQAALAEVKTLQGILPICSHCKSIRNDQGYWERVEAYISRHSQALFSHSICPPCLRANYPREYELMMAKGFLPK